jgi:hypothetical protein
MGSEFWNAVGAIGQWVGAIATAAAVWVALYQIRAASITKLKIHLEEMHRTHDTTDGRLITKYYTIITVTNVGPRIVVIQDVFFRNSVTKSRIPYPFERSKLPYTLQDSDIYKIPLESEYMLAYIKNALPEGKIAGLDICFRDSHGKIHSKSFYIDTQSGRVIR